MGIAIGPITTRNAVFLAPMSGITDAPFRRLAHELGAGLVVSEMIASADLAASRPAALHRLHGDARTSPRVIQLAGREPRWMAEGARIAEGLGADIIDINMGCPARQVTRGLSGSALMRDLPLAVRLIEASVGAARVPVTLKMRLGWDDRSRNAPELARLAERAGVQMVSVHGRTRSQFFNGTADWRSIRAVKEAVSIPVIANGDVTDFTGAARILEQSRADGLMIGRGARGRPWFPGQIAEFLETGKQNQGLDLALRSTLVHEHYDAMLVHYGREIGVRCARKHLGWYIETTLRDRGGCDARSIGYWRARLCREDNPDRVHRHIDALFRADPERKVA